MENHPYYNAAILSLMAVSLALLLLIFIPMTSTQSPPPLIGWIASRYLSTWGGAATAQTTIASITFKKEDCFQRDGMREPWEGGLPDGIIAWRGYAKYLIMWRDQAERTGGAPKWSQEMDIREFDSRHHLIGCPQSWREHGLAKYKRK